MTNAIRITATHESGNTITLTRTMTDAARTIELLRQSGYVTVTTTAAV